VSSTPGGSFPKSAHLLKHADFRRVYEQGKRHFSGNMTFFYLAGPPAATSVVRIGFTVPRALGGAVERNRIRRRTREAVRHNYQALLAEPGAAMDVVINPRKSVLKADFAKLSREVAGAFAVLRRSAAHGGAVGAGSGQGDARAEARGRS
jgi:ribonuclease P protein component